MRSPCRFRVATAVVVMALLGATLSVVTLAVDIEPAATADDGSLEFSKSGPRSILYGENVTYTLRATHNGTGGDGYNLTFRDVLPPGATFVSSSVGNPLVIPDAPASGSTTLLFANVADLQAGVTREIDVTVDLSEATYAVGSTVPNSAGAYMSGDPRLIPDFAADGTHIDNGDTSAFDTDDVVTGIEAIRVTKSEPSAEAELLRGVHTEWTTYSLQVDNNLVDPTDDLVVEDWLPAGLEFLGCGGIDQTEDVPVTNASGGSLEEYAGSGPLGAGVAPADPTGGGVVAACLPPTSVETVTLSADEEFDGQAAGVYTHVVWDLSATVGTLAPGDQLELMYAAGIPLRENTATFSASHTNADHTADLDNNNGPFTTDEQELTNWSRASAVYNPGVDDLATVDEDTTTVTAEDLSIHKTVDDAVFTQTELPSWNLSVETGEYRSASGIVVTDTLPDGQCPILSSGDPETPDFTGECAQTGALPSPTVDGVVDDPDTSTENPDGSWTLVWSTVPDLGVSEAYEISFSSRVRVSYQESFADALPVLGADRFRNDVVIEGTTSPITDGGTDLDRPTETTLDASSAAQGAATVELDKSISQPTAPGVVLDCDAATWTTSSPPVADVADLAYRPGDRVCYRIVVDFLGDLHFRNPKVTDFIPPNTQFERFWGDVPSTGQVLSGSDATVDEVYDVSTGPGTAPGGTTTQGLEWALGTTLPGGGSDLYVENGAERFEAVFSVVILDDPRQAMSVDLFDNLGKLTIQNSDGSGGTTFSSRDQAGYLHVEPNVALDKRNGLSGASTDDDPETASQLDVIDYEVDITNEFESIGADDVYATAYDIRVWDLLPEGVACTDLVVAPTLSTAEIVTCLDPGDGGYPLGGQATDGRSVLAATIASLSPQATSTLSYSIALPATVAAGESLVNDAGVRDYTGGDDNVGSGDGPTYYPADNIDEDNVAFENAAAADDSAVVNVPGLNATKVQGSGDADAGASTNRSNSPESAAQQDATIGETVTYTFAVTIPEGTDLYDAVVTDDLDTELDFVGLDGGSLSLDGGGTSTPLVVTASDEGYFDVDASGTENAGDLVVGVVADVVTVAFPPNWSNPDGSLEDILSLSFSTIVRDAAGVDIGDNIDNRVEVDWNDAGGDAVPTLVGPSVRTKVVEPDPQIAKSDDGTDTDSPTDGVSNVAPGDTVTYELVVTNPAGSGAHVSAAYDLVVSDVLPEGVSFVPGNPADNPDGGVFAAGVPGGAEGTITWTQVEVPALADLPVGGSITIEYTVSIDDPAVASTRLTNTATVTAESREAESAGERDTYEATTTDTVELPLATLVKDVAPFDADPFDGSDTDAREHAVGEPVEFEITVAVPVDNQAYDLTVFDDLPSFLEFESYGTPTDLSASCARIGGGAVAAGDVVALTPDGQRLGWYLGDIVAIGGDCRITLPYTVHVDSVADTSTAGDNAATLVWHRDDDIVVDPTDVVDLGGEIWDETSGPQSETIEVVEPLLTIDKDVQVLPGPAECEPTVDADECDTESGATHRFTVTVTNDGDGDAHDVVVVDTLPVEGVGAPSAITGVPAPVYDAGPPPTLTWSVVGPIAAGGGSTSFTYDVVVGPSADLEDDQELVNTAGVTSYWGLSEADRESAPGVLINDDVPEYHVDRNPVTPDENTLTVGFPDLVIAKTPAAGMDDSDARVGEAFRWRLEVFNDGSGTAFDIDVSDDLPTGWLHVAGGATIDVGAGPAPLADPAGGPAGPLTWTDIGQLAPGESLAIEFDTVPQASLLTPATTGTYDHVNDSSVTGDDASGSSSNETGDYGDDNGAPDGTHGSDDDSARIRRVDLTLDKSIVESAPHYFGDFVTYRIVVTNDDSTIAVDPATGVTVRDVLPAEVVFDSAGSDNGTYDAGTDTWTLADPLAAGASATLDIVVRINVSTPFTNVAEVETTDQWDVDSTPGNHDEGVGPDEDDDDGATIFPINADLGNRIWFDVDADGEQDAGEPGIPGVDVEVSWVDPADGVTVITRTTTTDSEGEYSFSGLPQDIDLDVRVITTTLPDGLAPTFELVDDPSVTASAAVNRETVGDEDGVVADIELTGTTPSYLDVDFGYTGSGSLGDRIWYDIDRDGDQDPDEPGLDGIDVVVEWAGFDGVLGDDPATVGVDESLDDVTYPTTTAAGGAYLVVNLPAGDYTVTVDRADLPAGVDIETWDPEFDVSGDPADLDSVSTYTLGDGEDHDGVDFGYVGPGSLGDTVWLDLDSDGEVDDDEVGLGGVTVTLTFIEPSSGAAVTRTTQTDATGEYLFEGLPLGVDLTVTVDSGDLPGNVVPTHDVDDPADGSVIAGTADAATVTLTPATPDRRDVDFGYVGAGAIGDTVWLDLDGSGATDPQPDDILLPGVEVTLTYPNPGGTELVLVTTTDDDGNYSFTGLPDGDYTVSIDPATLPAGVVPLVDPDGGADNASAVTLFDDPGTPGVNEGIDLDQDFAYVGTGSIGDLVWEDLDASGTVEPGEAPLAGVDITVVWSDPVTGATATFVVTTGADGGYLVDNLPAGDYTVSIDPATLPEGMAPTFDIDGDPDRVSSIVLLPGEDRVDVDFGERREADLAIAKDSSASAFAVGSEASWTISVTNNGPAVADGVITVRDTVPQGVEPIRIEGTEWNCVLSGRDVACTLDTASLPVGATSSFDLVVEVEPGAAPGVTNTAAVDMEGGPADPDPTNDSDTDTVDVPLALLGLDKTLLGDLVSGDDATWRIVVTNYGPSPTTAPFVVTDTLPAGLGFVRADTDDFSCSFSSGTVTCTSSVVLAVGETASVDLVTTVLADTGETVVNTARVVGGSEADGAPIPQDLIDEILDGANAPGSPIDSDLGIPTGAGSSDSVPSPVLAYSGIRLLRTVGIATLFLVAGLFLVWAARRDEPTLA